LARSIELGKPRRRQKQDGREGSFFFGLFLALEEEGRLPAALTYVADIPVCLQQCLTLSGSPLLIASLPDRLWTWPARLSNLEFFFFLERGNAKGDVQNAYACDAGEQPDHAEASGQQTEYTALQTAEPEETRWQEHYP
jgi:hypothetical protein